MMWCKTFLSIFSLYGLLVTSQNLPPAFFSTQKPVITRSPTLPLPTREPTLPIPSLEPSSVKPFFFPTTNPTVNVLDPINAYVWNRLYPQACECAISGVAKTSCDQFKCTCTCDTTAGKCDYNCCCDPDCSPQQISRFTKLNVCAFNGEVSNSTVFCYSDQALYGVNNPKIPLGSSSPPLQTAVANALCVVATNNYYAGDYYSITPTTSATVFSTSDGEKPFNYLPTPSSQVLSDSFYDQNDSIAAFNLILSSLTNTQQLVSNGPGFFELPAADFSGVCNDLNFVTFENNVKPNRCNRPLSSDPIGFSSQCSNELSVQRFVNNLYIAKLASTQAYSGSATLTDVMQVTMGSVMFQDFNTGLVTDITGQWKYFKCQTSAVKVSSSSSSSNDDCSFSNKLFASNFSSVADLVCQGAVYSVDYIVNHDANNFEISSVIASVVLTDLPMLKQQQQQVQVQSFSVQFYSDYPAGASTRAGNTDKRPRSGNPGYLQGLPVVFGTLSNGIVLEDYLGLPIPSPLLPYSTKLNSLSYGSGRCPSFNESNSFDRVKFGYDVASGCVLRLTRQQLINLCCTGSSSCNNPRRRSPFANPNTGIPSFLQSPKGYVGIYGSADPLDSTQWLQITQSVPTSPFRTWNDLTSTCYNMYSSLDLQFLYTYSGQVGNPQNKIIAALSTLSTSDWTFNAPYGDNVTTQTFALSVSVSFINTAVSSTGYSPPPPPVLFKVPYDVFYPFNINPNSAYRITTFGSGIAMVVTILATSLFL